MASPAMAAHAAQASFERRDFSALAARLADDVAFRSPVLATPWRTKPVLERLGAAMVTVFDEISFRPTVTSGETALLRFDGRIGDLRAEGVHEIRVDERGAIEDMAMFIRPLTALRAVAAAMEAALDPQLLRDHAR